MFEREAREAAAINSRSGISDIFLFVGSALVFPNSILRIAEQEAGGVHALRVDTLRDVLALVRDPAFCVRKVFFDDRVAVEVFRDIDLFRNDLPEADWILAYRDAALARRLLDERGQMPRLMDILLLPMNLPICPWSSMLRLVLAGQFIAAGELMEQGPPDRTATNATPQDRITPQAPRAPDGTATAEAPVTDHGLTRREKEVLALVSQGGRNKTIAHKMALSEHTVKLHLHNAITKIGARNRTEAATWYLSRQLGEGR
ncbi:MAG: helix-turn-helix transcriptional regulator [Rhodobacterales bacterium]|nr:helix-turn-helix transcriptional regulator [Rhodobacterales bacterium]MDX5414087.1 helix-turn-helix transcriptional regulator [Rhodobacterales bacterium]